MPPNTTYSGWGGQLHSPVLLYNIFMFRTKDRNMDESDATEKILLAQKEKSKEWVELQISSMKTQLLFFMQKKKALVEKLRNKLPAGVLPEELSEEASATQELMIARNEWVSLISKTREELQQLIGLLKKQSETQPDEEITGLIAETETMVAYSKMVLSERDVIKNIGEFFSNENEFISNILKLKEILHPYRDITNLKKLTLTQRENITSYLSNIDELLDIYKRLNFYQPILEESNTLEAVIIQMNKIFNTELFANYINKIKALAHHQIAIDTIAIENKAFLQLVAERVNRFGQPLGSYTIRPPQHIARYSLQWQTITKGLEAIFDKAKIFAQAVRAVGSSELTPTISITSGNLIFSESACLNANKILEHMEAIVTAFNAELGIKDSIAIAETQLKEAPHTLKKRQAYLVRKILDLNLNTSIQNDTKHPEGKYFSPYLTTILISIYPDIFYLDPNKKLAFNIQISDPSSIKYETLCKALGFDLSHLLSDISTREKDLNLMKFDTTALNRLSSATINAPPTGH